MSIEKDNNKVNVEDFLLKNGFVLDTYYGTNKRFYKVITESQTLYVRIYSDVNEVVDVEYKHNAMDKYDKDSLIPLETIDNIKKLELLIKALFGCGEDGSLTAIF